MNIVLPSGFQGAFGILIAKYFEERRSGSNFIHDLHYDPYSYEDLADLLARECYRFDGDLTPRSKAHALLFEVDGRKFRQLGSFISVATALFEVRRGPDMAENRGFLRPGDISDVDELR